MSKEIPRVFTVEQLEVKGISNAFKRNSLIDPKEKEEIKSAYKNNRPLHFLPTYVEENNFKGELYLFGTLTDGSKTKVILNDYYPSFIVYGCETKKQIPKAKQALIDHISNYVYISKKERQSKFELITDNPHQPSYESSANIFYYSIDEIKAKDFKGYREKNQIYFQLNFYCPWHRKLLINHVEQGDFKTYSNDKGMHVRKLSRETKKLFCNWLILTNYSVEKPLQERGGNIYQFNDCNYEFTLSINDAKSITDEENPDVKTFLNDKKSSKNKSLVLAYDIETISFRDTGEVPISKYKEDIVFMICLTLHWANESDSLMRICISDKNIDPSDEWYTIVCGDEEEVIKTFGKIWNRFKPDIQIGFNDSQYDWPFIMGKIIQYDMLHEMLTMMSCMPVNKEITQGMNIKHNWIEKKLNIMDPTLGQYWPQGRRIKIANDIPYEINFLAVPGCVHMDVRACFIKLFPKNGSEATSSKLKEFLRVCNLDNKEPLAIKDMWNYYLGGNPTDLVQVAKYCVIDAKRCQDLMVKKNVYNEYREVASLAFVLFHDVYLNANGIRVLNLVAAEANGTYVMPMQSNDDDDVEGEYQGAYVFKPEKGLVPDPVRIKLFEEACEIYKKTEDKNGLKLASDLLRSDRPVTGLDFSSLYPSIIMTYNFSPEMLILSLEEYNRLKDQLNLYSIIIDDNVKGWSVRHNNGKMGLYPTILKSLFDKRKLMKKEMHIHGVKKEQMDVIIAKKIGNIKGLEIHIGEVKANIKSLSSIAELSETEENKLNNDKNNLKILEEIQSEASTEEEFQELYEKTEFKLKHCDSKQKALKVYMNTFYGVTGLTSSPLFQLEIASGITAAGRYNIQMVEKFVRKLGFHIKYGDTDSLYLSPPCSAFYKCDREYASGKINKEEWYRKMVEITMVEVGSLQKKVNDFLEQDNGTKFLKMAYEEVLFPVLFAGKKKYCGIPHEAEIIFNTDRKRLFIKGMDVVKSNQTPFSINTMYDTIQTLLDINNTKTLLDIVHETIDKAKVNIASQDIDSFILYKKWKPPLVKCQHKSCTTNACYKNDNVLLCQAHSIRPCKKCTNRSTYVSQNGNYYCGIHKQQKHIPVDSDDPNLYQGIRYSQYDKEMWVEGKGSPTVLKFISRVYDERKKKQIINERKIKQNGGSSDGLKLETLVEMPEYGDEIPHVITLAENNFHLNGNVYNASVSDRMEYPEKVLSGEKQIDCNYYLENQLYGQLARVINGLPQFDAETDAKSQEMAKKYLSKYLISEKQGLSGKDIKKQYDPILKDAVSIFDITTQFVKLLASEGLNKSNCNKRIEECIDVKSSSRIFIESALDSRGIRPDGYDIGDCKSNNKLAELKTSLNSMNMLGVKSEFNSLRSDARRLTIEFIDKHYDDLVFNISQFQECVKAIYTSRIKEVNITFDDLPEYDFSDLKVLNDKLIKISLLYKKRNELLELKKIVPSLYVHTVNKVFTPDSASKVLAEQMKLLKQKNKL